MLFDDALTQTIQGLRPLLGSLLESNFWEDVLGIKCWSIIKTILSNETLLLSGSVFLGPTFASYIHSVYQSIRSFIEYQFYVSIEVDDQDVIYKPITSFVAETMKQINLKRAQGEYNREGFYTRRFKPRNDGPDYPTISLQPTLNSRHKFHYKNYTFWVERLGSDQSNNVNSGQSAFYRFWSSSEKTSIRITMRGRNINILKLFLEDWIKEYYAKKENKLVVYKCVHSHSNECTWEEKVTKEIRTTDSVILKKGQMEEIIDDAKYFLNQREWYINRSLEYRRGILLRGPPGTGKTSVIRCLASHLKMKLASISLTSISSDEELANLVTSVPGDCILLLEDVDHCLKVINDIQKDSSSNNSNNDQQNNKNGGGRSKNGHITLPGLLSVMDGVDMRDGLLFFMTCNDHSILPPVMTRRGRIDKIFTLDYVDEYQVHQMFARFFKNGFLESDTLWQEVSQQLAKALPPQVTPAELQGLFLDYYFYLEKLFSTTVVSNEKFKNGKCFKKEHFDHLFEKVEQFKKEIQEEREQAEAFENYKLSKYKEKLNNDATT